MRNHFFKLILPVVSLAAAARAFAPMADPQLVLGGTGNNGFDSQDFVVNEGKPSISDLMTVDGSLSIFYGYLRESTGLVERLANPLTTTTIFAPKDAAIINLARRPHQGPASSDQVGRLMTEDDEKERARYLEDWIKSHLVAGMNVELAEGKEYETLASTAEDNKISFKAVEGANEEAADWEKVTVQPGDARILAKKEGTDGIIYVLDQVLRQ